MKQKLGLDFVEWLWAINRGKEKEYYKDNYGLGSIEFSYGIGGQIVRQFFNDNETLLNIAYKYTFMEWNLLIWSLFPEHKEKYTMTVGSDFKTMTWVLFRSLTFRLDKFVITELVDDTINWVAVWEDLDKKYEVE